MQRKAAQILMGCVCALYIGILLLGVALHEKIVQEAICIFCSFLCFMLQFVLLPYLYRKKQTDTGVFCYVVYHMKVPLTALCVSLFQPWQSSSLASLSLIALCWFIIRCVLQTIYALARSNIFHTLSTGHNLEVLQLEKYLLYAMGDIPYTNLCFEIGLTRFYKRGLPKTLPIKDIFSKWCRTDRTEGSVLHEYGYDLGESLRIPNRPRLTPVMEEIEGAVSIASLLEEFDAQHANALFSLISYGERTRIRYSTFLETFRQISLERANLYCAIRDCRQLLRHFQRFLHFIEGIVMFLTFTLAMDMQSLFLHSFLSFLLVHVVVPGSVSFFESFIFLLVSHPYDNGDRVLIKGVNMIVKKVGLFSTCFSMWSGNYVIIQNNVVSKYPIVNIRRSISQYWMIEIPICFTCSNEAVLNLKKRLQWYVQEEKMLTGLIFAPDSIDAGNAVRVRLLVRKNSNFQNGFFTLTNFTKCLACIIRILTEERLYYKPPIARRKISDACLQELIQRSSKFGSTLSQ